MIEQFLIGAGVSAVVGLDRTALMQFMVSRPIVAAPLTGLFLGSPGTGLAVGALLELLWLGRLPMGAAIPPDDTQIAVASTLLACMLGTSASTQSQGLILLSLLVAIPLGKIGVIFDQWARRRNLRLSAKVTAALESGEISAVERAHLCGLVHFGFASLATFFFIVICGWGILRVIWPLLQAPLSTMEAWCFLLFPGIGLAHLLANLNVNRTLTLFVSSFMMAYMLLWLM